MSDTSKSNDNVSSGSTTPRLARDTLFDDLEEGEEVDYESDTSVKTTSGEATRVRVHRRQSLSIFGLRTHPRRHQVVLNETTLCVTRPVTLTRRR